MWRPKFDLKAQNRIEGLKSIWKPKTELKPKTDLKAYNRFERLEPIWKPGTVHKGCMKPVKIINLSKTLLKAWNGFETPNPI